MYRFNNYHRVACLIFLTSLLISACKAERTNPRDKKSPNYINTLYLKLSSKPSNIPEGTNTSIGVSLSEAVDAPLAVTISSDNDVVNIGGLEQTTLTFTPDNSTVYQMVTLNAIEDDDLVSNIAKITVHSGKTTDEVFSVTAIDNDVQNISLTGDTAAYEGGAAATLSIHLTQQPSSNVEVSINSGETATAAVSPGTLTFTPLNWNSNQTAVVTAVNDTDHDSKNVTITASATGVSNREQNVSCFDNDTAFIFGGVNGIHEGQPGRKITVKLSGNPLDPRTAGITSLDTGRITVSPASLVFNSANYMNPQEVTLTGLAEAAADGDNNVSISAAAEYIVTGSKTVAFCELRTVSSSVPADTAANVDPTGGVITVVFNNRSDYFDVPALVTKVSNDRGSTYTLTVPNTGSNIYWSGTNTLTIEISWIHFPENAPIQWSINGSFINVAVTRTFTTTTANVTYPIADSGQPNPFFFNGTLWEEDIFPYETYTVGSSTHPYGQDAHYTNIPNERKLLAATPHAVWTSDYTTKDNVTGLIWKSCEQGKDGADCGTGSATGKTWNDALNECAALNSANDGNGYAGITTWRLPTIQELLTIIDYSHYSPAIDVNSFPNPFFNAHYLSSTLNGDPTYTDKALSVEYNEGTIYNSKSMSTFTTYSRCVSNP